MRFRQFAFNNVLRRKRTYAAHFMSSSFSVMIFFIYALLQYHPSLQGQLAASSPTASALGTMGLRISQYFIFVFSFLFLLYSAGAFLQVRKREFGILMMLGMSERQRTRLVFIENIIIGLLSILTGIGAGVLFTKLYLLIVGRLLLLEEGLAFYIPLPAIWTTVAAFVAMFLILAVFASRIGRRHQPLELIRSEEKPREEPKLRRCCRCWACCCWGRGTGWCFILSSSQIIR
ncbi:FtsX-like permease family protein [Paenibacillus sp. 1P07SE]|uniref:FtsX-like permease family protein n=1 Tax=Paenibacillus sp. 1P07SE TaxID=3132209 RepID=UPI0039A57FB3